MNDLNYMSIAEDNLKKIRKGAFLTVKAGNALNTMTIGWATFGFISKSGRDLDKFKMCNLEINKAIKVVSPIIKTPGHHYECKIIYKSAMNPTYLDKSYDTSLYPQKDYHTLYFGEIVACYETV